MFVEKALKCSGLNWIGHMRVTKSQRESMMERKIQQRKVIEEGPMMYVKSHFRTRILELQACEIQDILQGC